MKSLRKNTVLLVILIFFMASLSFGQRILVKKKPVLKIQVKADLKADSTLYSGLCPVTVKMTGIVTVPYRQTVEHYFQRSDGVISNKNSVIFRGKGSLSVPFTWKISKNYSGWVQFHVKTKNGVVKSKKVGFHVECKGKQQYPAPVKVGRVVVRGGGQRQQYKAGPKLKTPVSDLLITSLAIDPNRPIRGKLATFRVVIKNRPAEKKSNKVKLFKTKKKTSNLAVVQKPADVIYSEPCFLKVVLSIKRYKWRIYKTDFLSVPPVKLGKKIEMEFKYKLFRPGPWKIELIIDAKGNVWETNEKNNSRYKAFMVR